MDNGEGYRWHRSEGLEQGGKKKNSHGAMYGCHCKALIQLTLVHSSSRITSEQNKYLILEDLCNLWLKQICRKRGQYVQTVQYCKQ